MTKRTKKKNPIEETLVVEAPATLEVTEVEAPLIADDKPTAVDDAKIIINVHKSEVEAWLQEAPEASMELNARWYGEQFIPAYKAWLRRGYIIAKQ